MQRLFSSADFLIKILTIDRLVEECMKICFTFFFEILADKNVLLPPPANKSTMNERQPWVARMMHALHFTFGILGLL